MELEVMRLWKVVLKHAPKNDKLGKLDMRISTLNVKGGIEPKRDLRNEKNCQMKQREKKWINGWWVGKTLHMQNKKNAQNPLLGTSVVTDVKVCHWCQDAELKECSL